MYIFSANIIMKTEQKDDMIPKEEGEEAEKHTKIA